LRPGISTETSVIKKTLIASTPGMQRRYLLGAGVATQVLWPLGQLQDTQRVFARFAIYLFACLSYSGMRRMRDRPIRVSGRFDALVLGALPTF
jgi:hypothetical protein